MDYLRLFKDNGIPYTLASKNTKEGHIGVRCPMCDDHSFHGNFDPKTGAYSCWRCKGSHPSVVIARLLHIPREESEKLMDSYGGIAKAVSEEKEVKYREGPMTLPGRKMEERHRKYLRRRGFDAEYLESRYGLLGTNVVESWEGIDVRSRVILPVYSSTNVLVGWQGRDITGQSDLRYKMSPIEKSKCNIKHTLYGAHLSRSKSRIVVVEGVFDLWRMGEGFVCSYGTSMHKEQIRLLKDWREIIFLFDPEPEAQAKATAYAKELAALGRSASVVSADFGLNEKGEPRDCGDLSEAEARDLRIELF